MSASDADSDEEVSERGGEGPVVVGTGVSRRSHFGRGDRLGGTCASVQLHSQEAGNPVTCPGGGGVLSAQVAVALGQGSWGGGFATSAAAGKSHHVL